MSENQNWTPGMEASIARIDALGDPEKLRKLVGLWPCPHGVVKVGRKKTKCQQKTLVYSGDPRARGWLRFECPCGLWGDLDTTAKLEPVMAEGQA